MIAKMDWRKKDFLAALFMVAFFVFYGLASLAFDSGTIMQPGPGIFPHVVATVGIVISITFLITAVAGPGESWAWVGKGTGVTRGVLFALSLIILLALTSTLGHVITIFLLVTFNSWLLGISKYTYALALGLCTSIAIYLIFGKFLDVGLFPGPFVF